MAEQATFFQENAQFFEGGVWQDDDQRTDVMALIVLDKFPIEVSSSSTRLCMRKADSNSTDDQRFAGIEQRRLPGRPVLVASRQVRELARLRRRPFGGGHCHAR